MKCPKCGYNSFESLDICKKCNADLSAFKRSIGIRAVVLCPSLKEESPATAAEPDSAEELLSPAADGGADGGSEELFSWDFQTPPPVEDAAEEPFAGFEMEPPAPKEETGGETNFSFAESQPAAPVDAETPFQTADNPFSGFSFEESGEKATEEPFILETSTELPSAAEPAPIPQEAAGEFQWEMQEPAEELFQTAEELHDDGIETLEEGAIIEEEDAAAGEFELEDFLKESESEKQPAKGPKVVLQELTDDEFKALFSEDEPPEEKK